MDFKIQEREPRSMAELLKAGIKSSEESQSKILQAKKFGKDK